MSCGRTVFKPIGSSDWRDSYRCVIFDVALASASSVVCGMKNTLVTYFFGQLAATFLTGSG